MKTRHHQSPAAFRASTNWAARQSMMRAGGLLIVAIAAGFGCSSNGSKSTGGTGGKIMDAASDTGATCGTQVTTGCTATNTVTAPADGIIADFSGPDGGIKIMGGITTYGGIAQPTYTMSVGSLNFTEAVGTSPNGPQYAGLVLFFNSCVNACAFQGVSFSIKGTITGCTMQFSSNFTQDVCNDGTTNSDPKGSYRFDAGATCPAYSPQAQVTGITSTAQTVRVGFNGPGLVGGVPETEVDNGHLTAVQWQFTIPQAGDGAADACIADITISDVKFY
jgi:hypothetical protein